MSRLDQPRPVPWREQEWLLPGTRVSHVVVSRDGSPARIVAPDPRWFALQKLWRAAQDKRNSLKRTKDAIQGRAPLDAIKATMRQFPLDGTFEDSLPNERLPFYSEWKEDAAGGGESVPTWNEH